MAPFGYERYYLALRLKYVEWYLFYAPRVSSMYPRLLAMFGGRMIGCDVIDDMVHEGVFMCLMGLVL